MLDTIRAFVVEGLASRPYVTDVRRRHAEHYRALAEQADRPLRTIGQREWIERFRPRPAIWPPPCAGTWPTTPRPYPTSSGCSRSSGRCATLAEARTGVNELLPIAESLDSRSRAELQWTAALTALRRPETELVDEARQVGIDAFDQAFAAGARLSQRDAAAIARDGA